MPPGSKRAEAEAVDIASIREAAGELVRARHALGEAVEKTRSALRQLSTAQTDY
jgi:hypothetical protein